MSDHDTLIIIGLTKIGTQGNIIMGRDSEIYRMAMAHLEWCSHLPKGFCSYVIRTESEQNFGEVSKAMAQDAMDLQLRARPIWKDNRSLWEQCAQMFKGWPLAICSVRRERGIWVT